MHQKKIGLFIAECRREKQLTQQELGDLLGVTNKSVSKWERGICLPDVSLFPVLCKILEIDLNELFVGERIGVEQAKHRLEETVLPMIEKDQRIKKIKKVILIISVILIPLLIIQWYAKFYTTFMEMPEISFLAVFYILAYYFIYKKIAFGSVLIWIIYLVLSLCFLSNCNFYTNWLFNQFCLDFWINVILTILVLMDKESSYKKRE